MLENNIIIAGGGHAGIEAAMAISKMGLPCIMVTLNKEAIARMSCNPAIGGLANGHLVKEIDALGGFMGRAADKTTIQHKILNKSKGFLKLLNVGELSLPIKMYLRWIFNLKYLVSIPEWFFNI